MDSVKQKFYEQFKLSSQQYDEYMGFLESVEVMSDNKLYAFYQKKKKEIEELAMMFKKHEELGSEIEFNAEMLAIEKDESVKASLLSQNEKLKSEKDLLFEEMKFVFSKRKSHKKQQTKIEITTKQDVDFVNQIFEMINRYAAANNLAVEKEVKNGNVLLRVSGEDAYDNLKHFSGGYKKNFRGEETLALVVVIDEQIYDQEFSLDDVEIQTSRSGGAGGQHINKTESAIRLVHIPTGITAECQDERSQTKNKERAIQNLKDKILQNYRKNNENYEKNQRKRLKNVIFSETPVFIFDFDKNIVSHAGVKNNYKINEVLAGDLDSIINDLSV